MPDTATEIVIASTVLSSANAAITFTSIPSTYTDLRLVIVGRGTVETQATVGVDLTFNNDTSAVYSRTIMYGDGTTAASSRLTAISAFQAQLPSSQSFTGFGLCTYDIFSYAGNTFKTILNSSSLDKNGSGYAWSSVGLWRSTSAINRIDITASTSTWIAGTIATLYGIL